MASSAHLSLASGICQTDPEFSILVNIGNQSDGPADKVRISYRLIFKIISNGLIKTGQASTQALHVVHA